MNDFYTKKSFILINNFISLGNFKGGAQYGRYSHYCYTGCCGVAAGVCGPFGNVFSYGSKQTCHPRHLQSQCPRILQSPFGNGQCAEATTRRKAHLVTCSDDAQCKTLVVTVVYVRLFKIAIDEYLQNIPPIF